MCYNKNVNKNKLLKGAHLSNDPLKWGEMEKKMITVRTTAKNLKEYNARQRKLAALPILETSFIGFMDRGDGLKVRAYINSIKGTLTTVGDYFTIWFNCPYDED